MQSHYLTYMVMLLDGRRYSCKLNSKCPTEELFDSVISYLGIQEKEYFGLCYLSEQGRFREWLSNDKRLVEQDLPKCDGENVVHFAVKYYIDNICWLHDPTTVEQFYLQARESIYTEKLQCDTDLAFKLAALCLQEIRGDYTTDDAAVKTLKKSNLLALSLFSDYSSHVMVYNEVLRHYRSLYGWSRGKAIINYLNKATELKGYGVHFYQVKDKNAVAWWIGMSPRGIAQYSLNDTYTPLQLFKWNDLDNVYFRDKKFSIEVNQGSQGLSAVQQKQYSSVLMHAWYSTNSKLIKSMWQMAVSQHQFYLQKKVNASYRMKGSGARSLNDIVAELSTSVMSLDTIGYDHKHHLFDSRSEESVNFSLSDCQVGNAEEDLCAALEEQRQVLLGRRNELQNTLSVLDKEENEIRGNEAAESPVPIPATHHPELVEAPPSDLLSHVELEYEIQRKIVHAALRLAKEKGINSNLRREREAALQRAQIKMTEMERRLESAHRFRGRQRTSSGHRSLPDHLSDRTTPIDKHCSQGSLTSKLDVTLHSGYTYDSARNHTGSSHNLAVIKANNARNRLQTSDDPATAFAIEMTKKLSSGQSTLV